MASAPQPQPSKKNDYSSELELFAVVKKIEDLKKFFVTRAAILEGEPLYLKKKSELQSGAYMSPWTFNTMQSLICSIPGILIAPITWLFAQANSASVAPPDPVQENIYSVLKPLQPPFTLLLIVYVLAYCCLPQGYVSVASWRAAQRKYLYLDAAYGVWPQFLMALCIALAPLATAKYTAIATFGLLAALGFFGAVIWQVIVTETKVKAELFEYDYVANRPEMFGLLEGRPFFKFHVIGILGLSILVPLISTGLYQASIILANIAHKLRG